MPIYEYHCAACRKEFEYLVMSASETVACEACGSKKVEKKFSTFGVGGGGQDPACGMGVPDPGACPEMGCGMSQCSMN